ncbi:XRE family transcriptional regulator protein (plasmid) [Rhizobium etli 8C-3]|uniref:Transcriptional regulator with XRE-family HTH domain n=2 Tax=Rhizobium TaxID=379 RepID=A0A4R3RXB8_9HYPH|nr:MULTISPECIES: helix-turn-helix transcriptional regulator [Rhizobium]APO78118.1 XRE family transcriptional regulator protein [Rhizobium etli 8C-3]TCU31074.1 transcriptional regulator with XRE-family HTH domain [Rhizobium azibense]TCU40903.1 transcriptional regulator with XRE-family HTH domain [Rhizobium azibense]
MKAKSPNAIDIYVGGRLRLRRKALGLSQGSLADALGITFQQVQKYEKGMNRIGAGRLQRIAEILKVPIGFFFENSASASSDVEARCETDDVTLFMTSKEGVALSRAFLAIEDPNVRQKLLALTRSLGSANPVENHRDSSDQIEPERG